MREAYFFLMAMVVVVGCGELSTIDNPEPVRASGRAIYNGTPDTSSAHMAVVALTNGPRTGYFCSGTLITEDVVLTAAHCLAGQSRSATQIFFGQNAYSGSGDYRGISEWLMHADYDEWNLTSDIGIIRLSSPAPASINPIPYLPTSQGLTGSDAGATVDFAGFGLTETGDDGIKLHVEARIDSICPGPGTCGETVARAFDYTMSPGGPCNGDSGGPAFLMRDREYVAGITSYGDYYCTQYGVSTSASHYAGWIDDFISPGARETNCTNDIDDDSDSATDCDDPDCSTHPSCMGANACESPAPVACGARITGTTVGASSVFTTNSCAADIAWNGPEIAYELTVAAGANVTVQLQPTGSGDLDLIVLPDAAGSCDLNTCLAASAEGGNTTERIDFTMPSATRYLLVETYDTPSTFNLIVSCEGGGQSEICNNNVDDDGDTRIDCNDSDCAAYPTCQEQTNEICNNQTDDDGDLFIDCNDSDCSNNPVCSGGGREICGNQVDDDGNGFIDCHDAACMSMAVCTDALEGGCNAASTEHSPALVLLGLALIAIRRRRTKS